MSAQENAERVRRGYEAFNTGDMATLTDLFDENLVWHQSGRSVLAGDYKGRDATFGYFGQIAQLTDGSFRANLESLVSEGDTVVSRQTNTARRSDQQLNDSASIVFEMRGGKVVDAREYHFDQYLADEFWGEA